MREYEQLHEWLLAEALPLWGGCGFDRSYHRFHERLSFAGAPLVDVPLRLMVQARQIHVHALAALNGWHPSAEELAREALESMVRDYWRVDGEDGWAHSISRDGKVIDASGDLYAHAFVLLAMSSVIRIGTSTREEKIIDDTLSFLDGSMAVCWGGHRTGTGFRSDALRAVK